jgi:hypothetical protein
MDELSDVRAADRGRLLVLGATSRSYIWAFWHGGRIRDLDMRHRVASEQVEII